MSPDTVLGVYFAFLYTLFSDSKIALKKVFTSCKIDVTEDNLEGVWIDLGLEEDAFIEWQDNHVPLENSRVVYAYLSMLSLLIGKRLNGDNYADWVDRRVNGVVAKAGCTEFFDFLKDHYPNQADCEALYNRMSSLWKLRAATFHVLLASSKLSGPEGTIFQWCLDLLAWSEAGHLNKILTELVIRRRTALTIPEFRHEMSHLIGSMTYLKNFG